MAASSNGARASTAYGDLNNFDVFNDTGRDCYGFEIELDDVRSTDITYTYDWNHFGTPTITEDLSDPAHPKVFVRYAAKYLNGSFSAFTSVPAAPPSPTDGHQCTNPAVNIGCEHFGVGYYGNPSVVKYHWLVEDPAAPGTLIYGPAVNVATPSWTYFPPAPNRPVAQVQAVILAPPPPPAPVYEFGDAVWVKSIVTTSHNARRVELKDLVSDDPDDPDDKNWKNGEPDEVEVEWHLLQTEFNNPDGAKNELAGNEEALPNGDEVVTRRYEFYKYTGPLDPETNEAKCDNYPQISDPSNPKFKAKCDPAVVTVLGDYIGAQMAGFNVVAVLGLIDHLQDGELNEPYTPRTIVVGGNSPYVTQITTGDLPPGLDLDPVTGILSGTPTEAGLFSFSISATDADQVQVSKAYTLYVAGGFNPCDGVICTASDACHEAGVCDPATGLCSDPPAADGTACNDGNACTQTDTCQAGTCTGGNPVVCSAADQCHLAGSCDPATGACSNPTAADGTACNDGNACTQTDTCQAGTCTGGNPVVCSAADQCHLAGSCDPATGACSNPTAADGTACNDGNACTQTDTCQAGTCTGTGSNPACGGTELSLKLHAPEQAIVNKEIDYRLAVRNSEKGTAATVVATLSCSGPNVVATALPAGCAFAAGTVTCPLGDLRGHQSVTIAASLMADAPGLLTCSATVTSATAAAVSRTERTMVRRSPHERPKPPHRSFER
jgi:hypothetical protein